MEDVTAVVTGAGGGLGAAVARELAGECARVVVGGRDGDRLADVATDIEAAGADATAVRTDVRDEFDVERLVERAARAGGSIDVLVPAAVVRHRAADEETLPAASYAAFDDTLRTNVRGVFATIREAVPHLATDGRVVVPIRGGPDGPGGGGGAFAVGAAAALAVTRGFAADLDVPVGGVDVTTADAGRDGDGAAGKTGTAETDESGEHETAARLVRWAAFDAPGLALDGAVLGSGDRDELDAA